jgi:glucose 1-dehydrogenase
MCRNGQDTERGIKQIDGYGSESWCVENDYAVKLDPGRSPCSAERVMSLKSAVKSP